MHDPHLITQILANSNGDGGQEAKCTTTLKALSRDLRSLRQAIDRIGEQRVTLWSKS